VGSKVDGVNEVTVKTSVDTYTGSAAVTWGDPKNEHLKTVNIEDVSDLFGTKALGTVTAPTGKTFEYDKLFKWSDYPANEDLHKEYNNTATIVETKQSDSAKLLVNVRYEELDVTKTVETSFTRTYLWDITKKVTTENGYTIGEEETPKIWLYTDGRGDETATWHVCVISKGYTDSDFAISGTITIKNTGTQPAVITSLEDVLAGTPVPVTWSWPAGTVLPYKLEVGETLTGTYVGNITDYVYGKNLIYVNTQVDKYSGEAEIKWGDPAKEVNKTVHIKDVSDLFGTQNLGTVTYPAGDCFTYTKNFTYAGYAAKGEHQIYNNTATIVETGQSASAVLKVNVQQYYYETAWRFGSIEHDDLGYANLTNWGWSDGLLEKSDTTIYTKDLWAGAAQNDTTKGTRVGYVDVKYLMNGDVTVTYRLDPGFLLKEVHLWVGKTALPLQGKSMTNAPGQLPWPSKKEPGSWIGTPGAYTGWTITLKAGTFNTEGGKIYVAAHSVVGVPDPYFGPLD